MKDEGIPMKKPWPYEDIVNLPHHVSKKHPPMPMINRAAQFAPFAALTGYDDAVRESARLTDEMITLDETAVIDLNRKLNDAAVGRHEICLRYFVPDEKKQGGSYQVAQGCIRKIESGMIILSSGEKIPVGRIVDVFKRN